MLKEPQLRYMDLDHHRTHTTVHRGSRTYILMYVVEQSGWPDKFPVPVPVGPTSSERELQNVDIDLRANPHHTSDALTRTASCAVRRRERGQSLTLVGTAGWYRGPPSPRGSSSSSSRSRLYSAHPCMVHGYGMHHAAVARTIIASARFSPYLGST